MPSAIRRLGALTLAPEEGRLHRLLGDEYLNMGESGQASDAYHRALGFEPNDAGTLNNLGCAYLRRGRAEEAALAFKAAVLLDPSMKEAKENAHDVVRGIARRSFARHTLIA
jgi:Flp pilus assembly protein TadD